MNRNTNTCTRQTVVKLLIVELLFWQCSALFSYFSVYFQSLGLSASETGNITGLNSVIGVVAIPMWGLLSDKIGSTKKVLILTLIGTAALYWLIPVVSNSQRITLLVAIVVIISSIFRSPLSTLVDNIVIRSSNKWGLNYGFLRAVGSIGSAVTSILLGIVIPIIGIEKTFTFVPLIILPLLGVVIITKDERDVTEGNETKSDPDIRAVYKNYAFITFLVFNLLVSIATQSIMTFSPYLMADIGVDGSKIGIVFGWQGIIQIFILLLLKNLREKFALYKMLIAAGFLYTIVCFSYAMVQSLASILFFATFAGMASGLLIACCNNYIFEIAESELVTTYQGFMYSVILLAGIFGNVAGGKLIDDINIRNFYKVLSLLVFSGTLLYVLSFKIKKVKSNKGENKNVAK